MHLGRTLSITPPPTRPIILRRDIKLPVDMNPALLAALPGSASLLHAVQLVIVLPGPRVRPQAPGRRAHRAHELAVGLGAERRREEAQLRQPPHQQRLEPHRGAADDAQVDFHDGPHAQDRFGVGRVGVAVHADDVGQARDRADDDAGRECLLVGAFGKGLGLDGRGGKKRTRIPGPRSS